MLGKGWRDGSAGNGTYCQALDPLLGERNHFSHLSFDVHTKAVVCTLTHYVERKILFNKILGKLYY